MDKIEKALRKLIAKERRAIKKLLEKIVTGDIQGLDIKKLKSREDIFRVRKGNIRVMYRVRDKKHISVLAVERRSEKTYKKYK